MAQIRGHKVVGDYFFSFLLAVMAWAGFEVVGNHSIVSCTGSSLMTPRVATA